MFRWVHTELCRQQAEPYLTRAKTVDIDGRRFKKLIRPRCPESIMETSELEPPRFKCWRIRRRVILFFFFFFFFLLFFFFFFFFSFFLRRFISTFFFFFNFVVVAGFGGEERKRNGVGGGGRWGRGVASCAIFFK